MLLSIFLSTATLYAAHAGDTPVLTPRRQAFAELIAVKSHELQILQDMQTSRMEEHARSAGLSAQFEQQLHVQTPPEKAHADARQEPVAQDLRKAKSFVESLGKRNRMGIPKTVFAVHMNEVLKLVGAGAISADMLRSNKVSERTLGLVKTYLELVPIKDMVLRLSASEEDLRYFLDLEG